MTRLVRGLSAAAAGAAVVLVPGAAHAADGPSGVDHLWVLIASALIFFMQTGFLCLEVGFVRPRNVTVTAMKNVVDWCVVSVIWMAVGFGLAFGHTVEGWIGGDLFWGDGIHAADSNGFAWTFFLFQLGFAGTSATIVSGAMAERVAFTTYIVLTIANGLVIYPVVAHWVWGNSFFTGQQSWLNALGFHDFAGSTAVHCVGGWISLVGIWVLGPRLGRFDAEGRPREMAAYSLPLVGLGVFFLWFGWWGFNGGSTLRADDSAAQVIVNTNLAGATGGLVAFLHGRWFQRRTDLEAKFLGGILAGLVAITAGAYVVDPLAATIIGALAGVAHNLAFAALLRFKLDDPVGAVPVHLAGGLLGTLCVGLFGDLDRLQALTGVANSRLDQIVAQLAGMGAVAVWTVLLSIAISKLLKATVGMRASPQAEAAGLTLSGEVKAATPVELDREELLKKLGGGD